MVEAIVVQTLASVAGGFVGGFLGGFLGAACYEVLLKLAKRCGGA